MNPRYRGTLLIDLRQSLDEIWSRIRNGRRKEIKQAERLGIEIKLNPGLERKTEWLDLFESNMSELGLNTDKTAIKNYLGFIDGKVSGPFFIAILEGNLLSGEIYRINASKAGEGLGMSTICSATRKNEVRAGLAHALLIWKTIEYTKAQGYDEYDFGGWNCYRPDQRGVNSWKESFGGSIWWGITHEKTPPEQQIEQDEAMIDPNIGINVWFDDGHISINDFGPPIFREIGVTPTVAIVTDYVGKRLEDVTKYINYELMTVEMLRNLIREGWEIASHTKTHRRLSKLSWDDAVEEIVGSKKWIEENLGITPKKFAAPFNDMTEDQKKLAESVYEYVRPRIPPRPPQKDGIHAILHAIIRKEEDEFLFTTAIPMDLGFKNYIKFRLSKHKVNILKTFNPLKLDALIDPVKVNYITYNSPNTVAVYTVKNLQKAEDAAFQDFLTPPGRILDLGCGTGRTTWHLNRLGFDVVGYDIAPNMIKTAQQLHPNIDFRVGDASDLNDFKSSSFDHILFSFNGIGCIYPADKRLRCLNEITRVLRSDGLYIYSLHSKEWMLNHPSNIPIDHGYFRHDGPYGTTVVYASTIEEQEKELTEHGFKLLEIYDKDKPWIYYVAQLI